MKIIVESLPAPHSEPRWTPNTDVVVAGNGEMVVKLELAGLTREDLELSIDGNRLKVSGTRRNRDHEAVTSYLVLEIADGPFEIVFDVPSNYDLRQARAVYEVGFLRVLIPPRREGD